MGFAAPLAPASVFGNRAADQASTYIISGF